MLYAMVSEFVEEMLLRYALPFVLLLLTLLLLAALAATLSGRSRTVDHAEHPLAT